MWGKKQREGELDLPAEQIFLAKIKIILSVF
jgi:hypothetical protein